MKKYLFKTLLLSTSILTLGSAIIPNSAVFATEQFTVNNSMNSTLSIDNYSTTKYNSATDTTTVTITDQQLVKFMQDQGLEVPQELLNLFFLKEGFSVEEKKHLFSHMVYIVVNIYNSFDIFF
ncbi:TPA: hypothetical protein ACF1UP_002587 [Enterococcus hirae]